MTAKEQKKLFSKVITLDIFNSEITVFTNRKDFNTAMAHRGHEPISGGEGAAYHSILINKDLDEHHMLFVGIFDNKLSTIVHEATHIAIFFSYMIGHDITKFDELLPSLIAHITTNLRKFIGVIDDC